LSCPGDVDGSTDTRSEMSPESAQRTKMARASPALLRHLIFRDRCQQNRVRIERGNSSWETVSSQVENSAPSPWMTLAVHHTNLILRKRLRKIARLERRTAHRLVQFARSVVQNVQRAAR